MNFIKQHIITKIDSEIKKKQSILKHDGFYYFDHPIVDGFKKKINRFNRWNPYRKEDILPSTWYALEGKALMEILQRIKNNEFYIYKKIEGRDCKTRVKNEQVSR